MKSSKLAMKIVLIGLIILILHQVMVRSTSGYYMTGKYYPPSPNPIKANPAGSGSLLSSMPLIKLPVISSHGTGISTGTGISLPGLMGR